eukprot:1156016-Pelagomonas_calceolata.AAC.3
MNSGRGTLHAVWGRGRGRFQPSPEQPGPPPGTSPVCTHCPVSGISTYVSAPVAQHASEGNDMGSSSSSSSSSFPFKKGSNQQRSPRSPMSFVPLLDSGKFREVGPSRPQSLVCLPCTWAIGKEQFVKAHRADPVNSHIGTLSCMHAMWTWQACNEPARIASVHVPSSVEEERLFSRLAFIEDERRNRLEAEHLSVCACSRQPSTPSTPLISNSSRPCRSGLQPKSATLQQCLGSLTSQGSQS